jgi:hypothetical protein
LGSLFAISARAAIARTDSTTLITGFDNLLDSAFTEVFGLSDAKGAAGDGRRTYGDKLNGLERSVERLAWIGHATIGRPASKPILGLNAATILGNS